jgi:hypothetical protein
MSAAAAALAGFALISTLPAEAAQRMPYPAPLAQTDAIIQIGDWDYFHGDRHNAFRDDGWNDNRRFRRHHQRRHHARFHRRQFYFGFPFAFAPPFYPHPGYRNCFRTWDGYLVCR